MNLLQASQNDGALETAAMVLSPREGQEVAAVVDRLVDQFTSLEANDWRSLQDRLDMAFALAQWLREDLALEAPVSEIAGLLDALESRLAEDMPPSSRCVLEGAAKKASVALAESLVGTP